MWCFLRKSYSLILTWDENSYVLGWVAQWAEPPCSRGDRESVRTAAGVEDKGTARDYGISSGFYKSRQEESHNIFLNLEKKLHRFCQDIQNISWHHEVPWNQPAWCWMQAWNLIFQNTLSARSLPFIKCTCFTASVRCESLSTVSIHKMLGFRIKQVSAICLWNSFPFLQNSNGPWN